MDVRVSTLPLSENNCNNRGIYNDKKNSNNTNNKYGNLDNDHDVNAGISVGGKDIRTLAQIQVYRDILSAALSEPAFDGVWLWGFTDRHTWVKNFYYDDAPLIFDDI